jgi:ribonucleoside-triphosphate reductase
MADELGLPRPANITTMKPSGTASKIMDTTEGGHKPLGRYIFNKIVFPHGHELVTQLQASGYLVEAHPKDPTAVLVTLPYEFDDVPFEGPSTCPVNLESAVSQLNRYKVLQDNWTDHNSSITVSYDPSEIESIIDWLSNEANWDSTVGLSFMHRTDPLMTEDRARTEQGYSYLPQRVVDQKTYAEYTENLQPIVTGSTGADETDNYLETCVGGACPVR